MHDFCEVSDRPAPSVATVAKDRKRGGREVRPLEVRRGGSVPGAKIPQFQSIFER